MNPQGWFQSVTWLPKPVSTQTLTGFPSTHNNSSTHLSLPILHHPREWTSTLLCHVVPQALLLLSPSRAPVKLVQNIHAGTLRTRNYEKDGHMPMHLRHAGLKSWMDYTNDLCNQQYHGYSSTICFSFPKPRHR